MQRIVLAIAALAMGLGVAQADGPHEGRFNWTGLYAGLHAGHGWADWDGTPVYDPGTGPMAGVFHPGSSVIDGNGWLGGGQIGFNRQVGALVWGLEVDGAVSDMEGEKTFTSIGGLYDWKIGTQLDAFGTARLRLGITNGPLLFYGTGGVAFGRTTSDLEVTSRDGFDPAQVTAIGSATQYHVGWAAGAGIEWAFAPGWSTKLEWVYVDLGTANYRLKGTAYPGTLNLPHTTDSFESDLNFHTVKMGINYRF